MYNKLQDDLKTYMKNKDNEKLSVVRLLYSQIKNEAINLRISDISDDIFFSVLKKSIKQIKENIDNYTPEQILQMSIRNFITSVIGVLAKTDNLAKSFEEQVRITKASLKKQLKEDTA